MIQSTLLSYFESATLLRETLTLFVPYDAIDPMNVPTRIACSIIQSQSMLPRRYVELSSRAVLGLHRLV